MLIFVTYKMLRVRLCARDKIDVHRMERELCDSKNGNSGWEGGC